MRQPRSADLQIPYFTLVVIVRAAPRTAPPYHGTGRTIVIITTTPTIPKPTHRRRGLRRGWGLVERLPGWVSALFEERRGSGHGNGASSVSSARRIVGNSTNIVIRWLSAPAARTAPPRCVMVIITVLSQNEPAHGGRCSGTNTTMGGGHFTASSDVICTRCSRRGLTATTAVVCGCNRDSRCSIITATNGRGYILCRGHAAHPPPHPPPSTGPVIEHASHRHGIRKRAVRSGARRRVGCVGGCGGVRRHGLAGCRGGSDSTVAVTVCSWDQGFCHIMLLLLMLRDLLLSVLLLGDAIFLTLRSPRLKLRAPPLIRRQGRARLRMSAATYRVFDLVREVCLDRNVLCDVAEVHVREARLPIRQPRGRQDCLHNVRRRAVDTARVVRVGVVRCIGGSRVDGTVGVACGSGAASLGCCTGCDHRTPNVAAAGTRATTSCALPVDGVVRVRIWACVRVCIGRVERVGGEGRRCVRVYATLSACHVDAPATTAPTGRCCRDCKHR